MPDEQSWVQGGPYRLRMSAYVSKETGESPILVVVVHGDAPFNEPDYQYAFAANFHDEGSITPEHEISYPAIAIALLGNRPTAGQVFVRLQDELFHAKAQQATGQQQTPVPVWHADPKPARDLGDRIHGN
jgi:hypothetical protein